MEIFAVIPKVSPLTLDIMFGNRFGGQVTFPCKAGKSYPYSRLKDFAIGLKPYLVDLIPTAQKIR